MIKVTVASSSVSVIPYTHKTKNTPEQLRLQAAYAHTVDQAGVPGLYPEKFEFPLGRDQEPFPPGEYTYHPSAYVVRNGRLTHTDSRLVPIKSSVKPAQV